MNTLTARLGLFLRYGISGAMGGVVQTMVLYVWVSIFGFKAQYLWGAALGFCLSLITSFLLQRFWTFGDQKHHYMMSRQLILYIIIGLGCLGLNTLLLKESEVLFEGYGLNFFQNWYLVAQVIIIFAVALCSFTANYFVTFRAKGTAPPSA